MALRADIVTITITGIVASGNDISGVFGPKNGNLSLTKPAFNLLLTFDTTKGTQSMALCSGAPPVYTSIASTASSNPGIATLTIAGRRFTFGVLNASESVASGVTLSVPPCRDSAMFLTVGDGHYLDGSGLSGYVYPATGKVLTSNPSWDASFSDSDLDSVASIAFEISELGSTGQYLLNGGLIPTSIMVSGINKYSPEQKAEFVATANWLNALAGQLAMYAAACGPASYIPLLKLPAILCITGFGYDAGYAAQVSAQYNTLAQDPPDPNFMQIAAPVIPPFTPAAQTLPAALAAAINEFRSDLANTYGIQVALVTSINRASGAQLGGNTAWFNLQENAANTYNDQLAEYSGRTAVALEVLQEALNAAGATYTFTLSEASGLPSYIASNGLPSDVVTGIQQFFGTQQDLTSAANMISSMNSTALAVPLTGSGSIFGDLSSSLKAISIGSIKQPHPRPR